jgi:tetratricopeptide (TPR) repeat protein
MAPRVCNNATGRTVARRCTRRPWSSRTVFKRAAGSVLAVLCSIGCSPGVDSVESRLETARRLQASERFQDSIEPLEAILAEAPGQAEANHLLGTALLRTGAPTLALWPLRRATEAEGFATESGLRLASALLATGNAEQAIAAVEAVLAREPKRPEARLLEARAHLELRDPASALDALDAFVEFAPDDLQGAWLRGAVLASLERYPEATEAYTEMERRAQAEGNASLAAKSCTALAWLELKREQPHRAAGRPGAARPGGGALDRDAVLDPTTRLAPSAVAEQELRRCAEAYRAEPTAAQALADYLDATGQREAALEAWRRAVEASPDSLPLRVGLAHQQWVLGRRGAAKETLRDATRGSGDPRAWQALAELHRLDGEFDAAATALGEALARDPERPELGFLRANLLVEAGRLEEAEVLLGDLARPEHRDLLRGRLLLERGQPEAALRAFESGLSRWPDNAVARALAGRAAQELGDLERALEEYRESIRADARATDAGLAAARVARALGRPEEAVSYASYQIRSHPGQGLEAFRVGVLSAHAAGMPNVVDELLATLESEGRSAEALVLRAELAGRAKGAAAEASVLAESGLDLDRPENEPALNALANARVAAGRAPDALALADRASRARPADPDLHDLRGRILLELRRDAEARAAFDRALALDPDHARALAGLGALAFRSGDREQALTWFQRSVSADPNDPDGAYRAAQLAAELGRAGEAEERLHTLVARHPGHVEATHHLAWLLAERGEALDLALALARRAASLEPEAHVLDTLAFVQLRRGESDAALDTLLRALASHPGDATLRYRLATVRLARGETEAARRAFQEALGAGPFPEVEAARAALAALDPGAADERGAARPPPRSGRTP